MPVKGWMNIRSLPDTKEQSVGEVISIFERKYKLCEHCNGRGFILNDSKVAVLPGTKTVRYDNNEDLEKMNEVGTLISDTIKKIVETVVYGRKQCRKCDGFGFKERKSRKKKHARKKG